MHIHLELLPKLTCINCKFYLSHFPIYSNPTGGSLCGRCSKPSDNLSRNEAYEALAHNQKFPCRYNRNGCLEKLLPREVPDHENSCYYRELSCPTIARPSCDWNGFVKDLLEHFEKKHQMYLLRDGRFEMDFVNSFQENYLLPYGEELFILHTATYSKKSTFACTVKNINSCSFVLYDYKLVLESGNRKYSHEITNRIGETIEVTSTVLKTKLNDPVSIIAKIEILPIVATSTKDQKVVLPDIDYNMLREVECMVCMEYMLAPIYQCITGHSICSQCKKNLTCCPTCKQEFQNTQNFALEHLINYLIYPCKNEMCKFTAISGEIKQHEAICEYGLHECLLNDYLCCNEKLIMSNLYEHIRNSHYENLLEIETITMPFDKESTDTIEDCYIIRYHTKIFKLHFKFDEPTEEFRWAMQLVGSANLCQKYKFEIDIVDTTGNNRRVYFKTTCSTLSDKSVLTDGDNYLFIAYDQIHSLINNVLSYNVRILEE